MAIEKKEILFGSTPVTVVHDTVTNEYAILMTADSDDAGGNDQLVSQTEATLPAATTMQNAVATNANGTSLDVEGYASAILQIVSSPSMSGGTTVNFEGTLDDTTWVSIHGDQVGGSGALASTTTSDGNFRFNVAGLKSIRARISGYSAGTVTVKGRPSPLTGVTRNVLTSEILAPVAEDNTVGVIKVEERYSFIRRTTEGQAFATAGKVHIIHVSPLTATPTAGLLTIYDSTTEAGTVIWSGWIFATASNQAIELDVIVTNGCYVGFDATLANVSVTVVYRAGSMS